MSDLRELYQQVILDHNRNPRNFKAIPNATRKVDGDTIRDVGFTGNGCAISKASASVMSSTVKGKQRAEAESLFDVFHKLVTGENAGLSEAELGKLAAFSGVSEFPA